METKRGELRRQAPAGVHVPEGAVRVLESHHAADFEMEFGSWPFHKICWVAVGRGILEWTGGRISIGPDDFLLLPADWTHRFIDNPGEPLTLVILCLSKTHLGEGVSREVAGLWEGALEAYPAGTPICARTGFHRTTLLEHFRSALREQEDRGIGWETALGSYADQVLVGIGRGYCEERSGHQPRAAERSKGRLISFEPAPMSACKSVRWPSDAGYRPDDSPIYSKTKPGRPFLSFSMMSGFAMPAAVLPRRGIFSMPATNPGSTIWLISIGYSSSRQA